MTSPTSYSKFKYEHLEEMGIEVTGGTIFQKKITPIKPDSLLLSTLEMYEKYPLGTEKSRSEMLVLPVLAAIQQKNEDFTIFSGYQFDVDKSKGLKGHCDFILSKMANAKSIKSPVIAVVEAKKDNVDDGVPQCVAEMVAANLFYQKRGNDVKIIHGIVTSGNEWLFLRLDNSNKVTTNDERFSILNLENLLGALQTVIDFYKN
jgi:hypothetical protein